jgi:hypothetical protein
MWAPPESARCTNQATQNAHILPYSEKPEMNPKSQIWCKPEILKQEPKLALERLRSHLPWLWFTLALHKFPAKVPILVGRCDKPLQGHSTGAIRAPRHRNLTILRPWAAGGGTGARHLSPALLRFVARRRRKGMGGWHGQSRDGSGSTMDLAQLFYHSVTWINCGSHNMRWTWGGSHTQKATSRSHAEVDKLGVPLSPGKSNC